ncbi:MAG: TIR domain-containing protein [Planctomycetota bacterium]
MIQQDPKVFISYTESDAGVADKLATELQQGGADVFFAKWSIALGDSIVDKIFEDGLATAKFFLVLLSPRSIVSRWVREEINAAFVRRMEKLTRLIPVIIESCEVPLALRSIKWVDLTTKHDDGVRQLVKIIHGVTDKPAVGRPPTYVTELNRSVGGLTRIGSTIGLFLTKSTEAEEEAYRAFTGAQLQAAFEHHSTIEINDAIAELEQYGLVKTVDWFGTAPWRFGQVQPTYALYLHFADDGLGYAPTEDIKKVAAAVSTNDQTDAPRIAELTDLTPARINRAVSYLDDYGLIQVIRTLGTAPFMFRTVISTHQTRRFVDENCK